VEALPTGEYNKIEIFKMAASRFVEVSDKEISEIKMNTDQKTFKTSKFCFYIFQISLNPQLSCYGRYQLAQTVFNYSK
jgi:hypothetical protein